MESASRICSKRTGSIPVDLSTVTSAPTPSAISAMRPLNVPMDKAKTLRPGQRMFVIAISIAAEAGPETPMILSETVWKA